jgi:hypothetical protein
MEMTASTEAGVEEFNSELGGRHQLKSDSPAPEQDPSPVVVPAEGDGRMQPHDGMPSAHDVPAPVSQTETKQA